MKERRKLRGGEEVVEGLEGGVGEDLLLFLIAISATIYSSIRGKCIAIPSRPRGLEKMQCRRRR